MNGRSLLSISYIAVASILGFSAGRYEWLNRDSVDDESAPNRNVGVVTLIETEEEGSQSTSTITGSIERLSFAECRPRLDKLLKELGRAQGIYSWTSPIETARLEAKVSEIVGKGDFEEVENLLEQPDAGNSFEAPEIIFRRLAQLDPPRAAAKWLAFFDGKNLKDIGLTGLMEEWVKRDFREAEQWAAALEDDEVRMNAEGLLFLTLAKLQPRQALSRLNEINDSEVRSQVMTEITRSMSEQEVSLMVQSAEHAGTRQGLLIGWGQKNPDAMISWLVPAHLQGLSDEALSKIFSSAISESPSETLNQISPHLSEIDALRSVAAQTWWSWIGSRTGSEDAIKWAGQNGELALGFFDSPYSYTIMKDERMTEGRANRFLEALAELPDTTSADRLESRFLHRLVESFPQQALDYALENLPLGMEANHTISYATSQWARQGEAEKVVHWIRDNLSEERGRKDSLRFAMGVWAESEPEKATAYLMKLPDSERKESLREVAGSWAKKDPETFLSYLNGDIDVEAHHYFANSGMFDLAQIRGSARRVLPKVLQLPPGGLRHNGVRGLFGGWALQEPSMAKKALNEVPEGALRNTAITSFSGMVVRNDPKLAVEVSKQISVSKVRERDLVNRGKAWMRSDPETARDEISMDPEIPAAVKKRIFEGGTKS